MPEGVPVYVLLIIVVMVSIVRLNIIYIIESKRLGVQTLMVEWFTSFLCTAVPKVLRSSHGRADGKAPVVAPELVYAMYILFTYFWANILY